jgi:hypothetical protein
MRGTEQMNDREIAQKFAKEFNEWVIDTADFWTECNDDVICLNETGDIVRAVFTELPQ